MSQWRDGNHFICALHKRGFKQLGEGIFSVVLAKPGSDKVIKVCRGWRLDAWGAYAFWATQHGYAGNLAPKVFSYREFNGTVSKFYVAVVERLAMTLSQYDTRNHAKRDKARLPYRISHMEGRKIELESAIYNGGIHARQLSAKDKAFTKALRAQFGDEGLGFDLHNGNWMIVGRRLVLTDPLTDSTGTSSKRWRHTDFAQNRRAAA